MKTIQRTLKDLLSTVTPLDLEKKPLRGIIYRGHIQQLGGAHFFAGLHVCPVSGITRGFLENYECPRCKKNEGYLAPDGNHTLFFCLNEQCMEDDSNASKSIAREEQVQKNLSDQAKKDLENRERMKAAFGSLYHGAEIAKIRTDQRLKDDVLQWVGNSNNFLVFSGCSGCGKTYFCAAIYYHLLSKTNNVIHLPIRQYIYKLQEAINDNQTYSELITRYKQVKYLLIDDLGATRPTEWQREVILDLIDHRYEFQMPTVITTNLKYEAMQTDLHDRIASRVYDRRNKFLEDWTSNYRKK